MHMHQGKVGGTDCSDATDLAQCAAASGDWKFTAVPANAGESKILTDVLGGHFVNLMVGQEQKAHVTFGFCDANMNFAPGSGHADDQGRVMLYHVARAGHPDDPSYDRFKYFGFICHDGAPVTFTLGKGAAL